MKHENQRCLQCHKEEIRESDGQSYRSGQENRDDLEYGQRLNDGFDEINMAYDDNQ